LKRACEVKNGDNEDSEEVETETHLMKKLVRPERFEFVKSALPREGNASE